MMSGLLKIMAPFPWNPTNMMLINEGGEPDLFPVMAAEQKHLRVHSSGVVEIVVE